MTTTPVADTVLMAQALLDELKQLNSRMEERSAVYARLMIERDRAKSDLARSQHKLARITNALDSLTDADGGLSCIPPGPERDELEDAHKEAE